MKIIFTRTQVILLALLIGITGASSFQSAAYGATGPDLTVTEITLAPTEPAIGDPVIITGAIKNLGNTGAPTSYVTCYIDDIVIETRPSGAIEPGITTTVSFSWIATGGSHTIKIIADASGLIAESDENNNSKTYALTTSASDLLIESITWQPQNPSRGDTVAFSLKIKNQGNIPSRNTTVNFFIDEGARGSQDVGRLAPGSSITIIYNWTTLEGSHNLKAVIDENNNNKESDETNNILTAVFSTLPADLTIGKIAWAPLNPSKDDTVSFNVTVKNIGSGRAGQSYLGYYIDGVFLDMLPVPELAAAASYNVTFTWKAALDAHSIKVEADYYKMVNESNEDNNTLETSLAALPPDLIISNVTWKPIDPAAGDMVTFKISVKNQGGGRATPSRLILNLDTGYPIYLDFPAIEPGVVTSMETTWTAVSGIHRFNLQADYLLNIIESNENNNRYEVVLSVLPPDLLVSRIVYFPEKPVLNDMVSFNVTITNQGKGKASMFDVSYFIDEESLSSGMINSLGSGASANVTFKWKITGGRHIFKVVIDYGNMLPEGNEKNNSATISIAPNMPDLSITNVTWSPAEIPAGQDITFVIVVENLGAVSAGPSRLVYYADGIIAGFNDIGAVAAGAKETISFTWPASEGQHKITISADSKAQIVEIDEENNTVTVNVPPPDLAVQEVTYSPQKAVSGAIVVISAIVTNTRGSKTPASSAMFYVDGSSIGTRPLPGLSAGEAATISLPWTVEPGAHVFKVVADIYSVVMETDETNNEGKAVFTADSPDLSVDNVRWQTGSTLNSKEISFIITIKNSGASASGAFSAQCSFDSGTAVTHVIPSIPAGIMAEFALEAILSDGPHTVRILLDTSHEVTESNEANNNYNYAFSTLAPDLLIRSITWAPLTANIGDAVTITVKIENIGESTASNIGVMLKVDGTETGNKKIPTLESGTFTTVDFPWKVQEGSHTIDVFADAAQTITESNETNNTRSRTITFSKPETAKKTPMITTNATVNGSLLDNWWWMLLLAGGALGLGVLYTTIRNMRRK